MIRGLFIAAALCCVAGFSLADEPLDIQTAINTALAHNRDLAQRARAMRGAALSLAAARAEFGLGLQPDGGIERTQDEERYRYGVALTKKFMSGAEVRAGPQMEWVDAGDQPDRRTRWRVDLRQPLFRNFGPLVQGESVVQAQQQVKSARRDFERRKAELILEVVDLFETLIRLERQIAAEEASLQRLDKLLRLTRARERQGRATRVDTLRVELRHGEARSRLEENRERLSSQRRDFAELLGQPPDRVFALVPPPLLELTLPTQEEAARLALENRLDYAQALQDYEDARRGERIAQRGLWPDLSLLARYERVDSRAERSIAEPDEDRWFLGLSGDTDLNQARERAQLGQARLSRESAAETIRIRELSILREVQQQTSAYRRALQEMAIATRNHQLAAQRARLARRLYELGRGDNFSVTDAEDALAESEDRRLRARADASLAGYRFLNTVGTLLEAPPDLRAQSVEARP